MPHPEITQPNTRNNTQPTRLQRAEAIISRIEQRLANIHKLIEQLRKVLS